MYGGFLYKFKARSMRHYIYCNILRLNARNTMFDGSQGTTEQWTKWKTLKESASRIHYSINLIKI